MAHAQDKQNTVTQSAHTRHEMHTCGERKWVTVEVDARKFEGPWPPYTDQIN